MVATGFRRTEAKPVSRLEDYLECAKRRCLMNRLIDYLVALCSYLLPTLYLLKQLLSIRLNNRLSVETSGKKVPNVRTN